MVTMGNGRSISLKYVLLSLSVLIGLMAALSVALLLYSNNYFYRSQFEKAASVALGMDVRLNGKMRVSVFPDVHIVLKDVSLVFQGQEAAHIKEAGLHVAIAPLLHRNILINSVKLIKPDVYIRRDASGEINFEHWTKSKSSVSAVQLNELSVVNGNLIDYTGDRAAETTVLNNFNLTIQGLRITPGSAGNSNDVSFKTQFDVGSFRLKNLLFSDINVTASTGGGIVTVKKAEFKLFKGKGKAVIVAYLSGKMPRYTVYCVLTKFRLEEYLKAQHSNMAVKGPMDLMASLKVHGDDSAELLKTASGVIALSGEGLTYYGIELDKEFARFKSSQNFNLVDAGAYFFLGPVGVAVTKGLNFANVARGTGGSSEIVKFYSSWKIDNGIAQAEDVALSTKQNRVAMKGSLDFVKERYNDVTFALIDSEGRALVKQQISGPFDHPAVKKPDILMSLAGPALNIFKKGVSLVTGSKGEKFYTGSVPAPAKQAK